VGLAGINWNMVGGKNIYEGSYYLVEGQVRQVSEKSHVLQR